MIESRVDGCPVPLPGAAAVRAWSPDNGLLWINSVAPTPAELELLRTALQLHPLVIEDIEHRNQRPKVDEYPQGLFVVLFGAMREQESGELVLAEVHIVVDTGWLLTVTDADVPAVHQLWSACDRRPELGHGSAPALFHRICDALVDSVFPILDDIDDDIDRVETNIVERADETTVADIFRLKRELNVLRRVLGPQRDLLQALASPRTPGLDTETQLYLRDVYDHAVRMVEQVDAYRDIVTGALDVYLSSVSNRLGEQTRRLTIIATIFLPLTFLTGFFGMNFGRLVSAIESTQALVAGMVAMAVSVPIVLYVSQRLTARVQPVPPAVRRRHRRLFGRPYTRHRDRTGGGQVEHGGER